MRVCLCHCLRTVRGGETASADAGPECDPEQMQVEVMETVRLLAFRGNCDIMGDARECVFNVERGA
jgi:hypothetical protein